MLSVSLALNRIDLMSYIPSVIALQAQQNKKSGTLARLANLSKLFDFFTAKKNR